MLHIEELAYSVARRLLIQKITFSFNPGNVYAILGPNGAGKTTLLKTLCGILKPSHGKIYWNNENLALFDRKALSRTITLVPQNPQMVFNYSVEDFVAMGLYVHGRYVHGGANSDKIIAALEAVDCCPFMGQMLFHLSQGERQRVYIARALATEAPVMLFDEPTAHLDIKHQWETWQLCRKLADLGKVVIISNHDLVHSQSFCDEALLLEKGQCVAQGKMDEILPHLESIFGMRKVNDFAPRF